MKPGSSALPMPYGDQYPGHWLSIADAGRASGIATPDVDWLAGFLNKQHGTTLRDG